MSFAQVYTWQVGKDIWQMNNKSTSALVISAALIVAAVTSNAACAGDGFSSHLELQGVSFDVSATNEGSINQLTTVPHGLSEQMDPITVEIDGTVSGAEIDDLDANGFPEVYIYVTSAGSGSCGSLVGYAVNKGKSMMLPNRWVLGECPRHGCGNVS